MIVGVALIFCVICATASYTRAYLSLPWIDIPLHTVFGAWFALLALHLGYGRAAVVVGAVTIVGIGWELFELGYDRLFAIPRGITPAQHGWDDTLSDMLANTLGAMAVLMYPRQGGDLTEKGSRP